MTLNSRPVSMGACLTEVCQPFFGRTASFDDLFRNGLGIFIGVCMAWFFGNLRDRIR